MKKFLQKTKNLKSVSYLKGKAILVIVFKIWFISTHCAIRYEFCQEGRQTVAAYFLWIIFRERRFRFEFLYLLFRFWFFLWIKMKEKVWISSFTLESIDSIANRAKVVQCFYFGVFLPQLDLLRKVGVLWKRIIP